LTCHSEEQSDEESLFNFSDEQERVEPTP